jgi:hypothetical protein
MPGFGFRRLTSLATFIVLLALYLVACGSVDTPSVATHQDRLSRTVPEYGASPPWVSVEWENVDVHATLTLPTNVAVIVKNNTTDRIYLTLTLTSFGLETRQASRALTSFWISGGVQTSVVVALSSLPIRSIGSPSSVHVEALLQRSGQSRRVTSTRMGYQYGTGLSTITLWGSTGRRFDLRHPGDSRTERARMHTLDSALSSPQGDVWDPAHESYTPVGNLPPVGGTYYRVWGEADFWEAWPDSYPAPGTPLYGEPGTTKVCANLIYKFYDVGVGEDYYTFAGFNPMDAGYAGALLQNLDTGAAVWGGWLDYQGCTPGLSVPPGLYALTLASRLKAQNVTVDVETEQNFDLGTQPSGVPIIGFARALFTMYPTGVPTDVEVTNYLTTAASNTMVVANQILQMPDNGLTQAYITAMTRDPDTNTIDCWDGFGNETTDAAISYARSDFTTKTSTVCLGRRNTLVPSDTWSKFVIGHEFGHVAQGLGTGVFSTDYAETAAQALCRCDNVKDGNQIHCLQSREHIGPSQAEGFAQLYSSRLFNDPAGADCWFGYYKEFTDSSGAVHDPPYPVNCKQQVKWMENQCLASNRGVEYDWLEFYYDINTAPAAEKTILPDLWQVYLGACGPNCDGADPGWTQVKNSALAYYGGTSAKYSRVVASGNNFGVDH